MRCQGLIALLLAGPAGLAGQGLPGTGLTVSVTVSAVTMSGDTATISYVLANDFASLEQLAAFTVNSRAAPVVVLSPTPPDAWAVASFYRDRTVAQWVPLDLIAQGGQTPALTYRAVGLPGIDTAWYRGNRLPSTFEDDTTTATPPTNEPPQDADPLLYYSVSTLSVAAAPMPLGATPASLTARLDSLRGQSCSMSWVSSTTLCSTLHGYLTSQPANLAQFNADLAANHTSGGSVNDNAYWLLKANADYIISISSPPVDTALINASYICGNKFKVRNVNTVAVPLTWNVVNGSETGAVTVPAKQSNGEPGSVFITTIEKRTLRLYYNGQLIIAVANGNKPPC